MCATAYFSDFYTHCDWSDGVAGNWWNPPVAGGEGLPKTLLVRGVSGAVPKPASRAMMITGFALIGAALRRRVALHTA